MPAIRLTGFFRDDDGHGWSESHDKDGGSSITSLTTYLSAFHNLMITFRRPLLAGDAFYIGCRASYKTASGAIAGDNILSDPPLRGPQTYSGQSLEMTAPEVAIKTRLRNDSSTARSDVYIRGFWSQCVLAGVLDFSTLASAQWKVRADAYLAALIANNYGWVGVSPTATSRGNVTGYTSNANGTVTLNVTPTNSVNLPAAGTKLPVKFARINGSRSILNRQLVCIVEEGGASLTTIEKIAVSDFETNGTYIAEVFGFVPYAAQSYYKLAKRATGRPFGVGPGRRSAAVLH